MNQKKLLIRADGNALIGAGHVMRCLSIADAAKKLGIECLFVTADDSYEDAIERAGISHKILNSNYLYMEDEIKLLSEVIDSFKPTLTIVDSYSVTAKYLTQLCDCSQTAYIDDIKAFPYPVDILINYNSCANLFDYPAYYEKKKVSLPYLLLGERYVPLRNEFQNLIDLGTRKNVTDILFSAGGADPERMALKFVKSIINDIKLKNYKFHLVLGKYEPDIDVIKMLTREYRNLIIHENVIKMADLMKSCDIAVSAAGSTLYELCACGIPTITYILEDNQVLGATSLSDRHIMINAGDVRTQTGILDTIKKYILELCYNEEKRNLMHKRAICSIDGKGAMRLVEAMVNR